MFLNIFIEQAPIFRAGFGYRITQLCTQPLTHSIAALNSVTKYSYGVALVSELRYCLCISIHCCFVYAMEVCLLTRRIPDTLVWGEGGSSTLVAIRIDEQMDRLRHTGRQTDR
jgi:hypothetical protein